MRKQCTKTVTAIAGLFAPLFISSWALAGGKELVMPAASFQLKEPYTYRYIIQVGSHVCRQCGNFNEPDVVKIFLGNPTYSKNSDDLIAGWPGDKIESNDSRLRYDGFSLNLVLTERSDLKYGGDKYDLLYEDRYGGRYAAIGGQMLMVTFSPQNFRAYEIAVLEGRGAVSLINGNGKEQNRRWCERVLREYKLADLKSKKTLDTNRRRQALEALDRLRFQLETEACRPFMAKPRE